MNINKILNIYNKQKILFFACFFSATVLLITGCKKESIYLDENPLHNSMEGLMIDTMSFGTYTVVEDSVVTSNRNAVLLGSYNDPKMGKVQAGFYTQFRLPVLTSFTFDMNNIVVDSMVVGLVYSGSYGKDVNQKFEVYQMNEQIYLDSTYYAFSKKDTVPGDLMDQNRNIFTPNTAFKTIIDTSKFDPMLRLHLDVELAKRIMNDHNSSSILSSNETFTNYFKGLYFKVNNSNQSSGKGAIYSFNLAHTASKMTIYYTLDGVKQKFDFLINSNCADFNSVRFDNSNSEINAVINNQNPDKIEFFTQANFARALIKIPGLDSLPKKTVIHTAKLYLPVAYHTYNNYYPSSYLAIYSPLKDDEGSQIVRISDGSNNPIVFDNYQKRYVLNLQSYIQSIMAGVYLNNGIYISPLLFDSSVERINFNGILTNNKNKPKLVITYTTF